MSGTRVLGLALAVASLFAAACLPDFVGTSGIEGAEYRKAVRTEPLVWIADPVQNQRIPRSVLFGEPGLKVVVDGTFVPGHSLHLSATPEGSPARTFYVERIPVTSTAPPPPTHVRGDPSLLPGTNRVVLYLRTEDLDRILISLDSVRILLR